MVMSKAAGLPTQVVYEIGHAQNYFLLQVSQ